MDAPKVILKAKRGEILASYRHPWVFSKGLAQKPNLPAGEQVRVVSQDGRHLGWAFYHPDNAISLRLLTFGATPMDMAGWRERIGRARQLRRQLLGEGCRAYRLIHGENDGFPGLTVDVYGDLLVMQVSTHGMDQLKHQLVAPLLDVSGGKAVYERSQSHARRQEGLPQASGFLHGELAFPLTIEEHGLHYGIDPASDHKTGFYLDQRPQRAWVQSQAAGLRVLDLCCYSGGFSMAALRGGAQQVVSVDSSKRALQALHDNLQRNALESDHHQAVQADVFDYLKQPPAEPFDLVILDPPSLAKNHHAAKRARNGYRQLNRMAASFVKPGGLLLTFSCTGVVNMETFRQSVFLGLHDARHEAQCFQQFGPGADHPVHLDFPEGEYLKGLGLIVY